MHLVAGWCAARTGAFGCRPLLAGTRRIAAATGALALLCSVAGCGGAPASPTPAKAHTTASGAGSSSSPASATAKTSPAGAKLTTVSVETSFLPSSSQLPVYLALDRGYYKAAGLAVHVTSGHGSALTVQQVGAGHFNIGLADLPTMALARSKGAPVRAFMAEVNRTTFGVIAAKSAGIHTWKDLYGKRVLASPANADTPLFPATFAKLGLQFNRVHLENVPVANLEKDYILHKGSAVATDAAGAFYRENAKRPSTQLWFGDQLNMVGYGYFARQDYMQAHPAVIRAFAAATARALTALGKGPAVAQAAAQYMVHYNPHGIFSAKSSAAPWPLYEKFIQHVPGHPVGWQNPAAWTTTLSVLHKYAGLKGDMNVANFMTNKYLPAK